MMAVKRLILSIALILTWVSLWALPAQAQQVERIVAVVNDQAVTLSDLNARIRMTIAATKLPDNEETRRRIMAKVLRSLIDENLKIQEAKRLGIDISEEEVQRAVQEVAARNKLSLADLEQQFASKNIPITSLAQQLEATIAWSKIVASQINPKIEIGEEEIDSAIERFEANIGKPEYLAAEIFLSVDQSDDEKKVRDLANRLIDQMRQGSQFSAIAGQFSEGAGAPNGGDLGWVQQGQLGPELDEVLAQMPVGALSKPIRTFSGYHILLLRDKRKVAPLDRAKASVDVSQIIFPLRPGQSLDDLRLTANMIRKKAKSCAGLPNLAKQLGAPEPRKLGKLSLDDMPSNLGDEIMNLKVGEMTAPLPHPSASQQDGVMVLMVCSKEDGGPSSPQREKVRQAIGMERLDMMQRRYIRDLRREAYIEIRV